MKTERNINGGGGFRPLEEGKGREEGHSSFLLPMEPSFFPFSSWFCGQVEEKRTKTTF